LRLTPSVPLFGLEGIGDLEVVVSDGNEYSIPKEAGIQIFVTQLHKDTKVWGEDVEVFRPERMLDGGFEKAPVSIPLHA
jgi:cytochrome P450/NADPH-cytochrome P450 reductase